MSGQCVKGKPPGWQFPVPLEWEWRRTAACPLCRRCSPPAWPPTAFCQAATSLSGWAERMPKSVFDRRYGGADRRRHLRRRYRRFHRSDGHLAEQPAPDEMNRLAKAYEKLYHRFPVRCIRQIGYQPLLNQGARKNDIAASIFTLWSADCRFGTGREIKGNNIVYLGGLTFLSEGCGKALTKP